MVTFKDYITEKSEKYVVTMQSKSGKRYGVSLGTSSEHFIDRKSNADLVDKKTAEEFVNKYNNAMKKSNPFGMEK
jgi:hypothetical protein